MTLLKTLGKPTSLSDEFKLSTLMQRITLHSGSYILLQDTLIYIRDILRDFLFSIDNLYIYFDTFNWPGRSVSSTTRTTYRFPANYRFMSAYRFQQGTASRMYLFSHRPIALHSERTLGCCATYGYAKTHSNSPESRSVRLVPFCNHTSTLEQEL